MSSTDHGDKFYVKKDNVYSVNDELYVKSLWPIGINQKLHKDEKGCFVYESELENMVKGRYHYHYCGKCNQEFLTDGAYNNHCCRPNYYDRGSQLFSKNPE